MRRLVVVSLAVTVVVVVAQAAVTGPSVKAQMKPRAYFPLLRRDAPPRPTPIPSPTAPTTCREHAWNGGFEMDRNGWEELPIGAFTIWSVTANANMTPAEGRKAALFAPAPGTTAALRTFDPDFIGPTDGVASASVRFKVQGDTAETNSAGDMFGLYLTALNVTVIQSDVVAVHEMSSDDVTGEWQEFGADVTSAIRERRWSTPRIMAVAVNDAARHTDWYLDDVRFTVCRGAP